MIFIFFSCDIKNLDPKWLRGQCIGYINQEPTLFNTSIKENIRYGRPDASDVEVYEAARASNCHSFIQTFPDGKNNITESRVKNIIKKESRINISVFFRIRNDRW